VTRIAVVALALAVLPVNAQEIYDLLLKGGQVIDPKNKRNGPLDIAVTAGRIQKVAAGIPVAHARSVVDVSDYYVTPGLIDIHAYLSTRTTPAGVNPDHNTLRYGVTTVVDAGSAGWRNFEQFKKEVVDGADVRVLAFLNIAGGDVAKAAEVIRKHSDTIVGIRAGQDAITPAVKAAEGTKTVVMTEPGAQAVRAGDIYTHMYRSAGAARPKGVLLDVGGLLFRIAAPAIKQGLLPDTISTGMDSRSVLLPRANMTNVMSKFLALGLTLEQVIERSTVNPAKAIRRAELGSIEEGGVADIAVLELRKGRFAFLDSGHAKLTTDGELRCVLTVRNGKIVWDTEGLSLADWQSAGPYSNFK
jgi:dihydroorotase